MKIAQALGDAVAQLNAESIDGAAADARKLLRHMLGSENVSPDPELTLTGAQLKQFKRMISQRAQRRPVAQILGKREFWGRNFTVTKDTLDPRPDSELIIQCALERPKPNSVLDLGTGTGCLLLSILSECPKAVGVGSDVSDAALAVAAQNASKLNLEDRAQLIKSDWFSDVTGCFDLIVSNPPYISSAEMEQLQPDVRDWEPHLALTPGGDGLDAYRIIAAGLDGYLNGSGTAIFEIGATQASDVIALFLKAGFKSVEAVQDLNGKDRAIIVRRSLI